MSGRSSALRFLPISFVSASVLTDDLLRQNCRVVRYLDVLVW